MYEVLYFVHWGRSTEERQTELKGISNMARIELLTSPSPIHIPSTVFPTCPTPCPSSQHLPRGSGWQPRSHPWFTLFPNPQHPNHQQVPFTLLIKYILNWTFLSIPPAITLEAATVALTSSTALKLAYPVIHSSPSNQSDPLQAYSRAAHSLLLKIPQWLLFAFGIKLKMPRPCMIWPLCTSPTSLCITHPSLLFRSRHSALKFVPEHADLVLPTRPLHLLFLLSKTFFPWLTPQLLSSLGHVSTQKSGKPLTCLLFFLIYFLYLFV